METLEESLKTWPPQSLHLETQESSSWGANHNYVVTVAGITGSVPTRGQAGSGGGNSSKYIYVLFSPQRTLLVRSGPFPIPPYSLFYPPSIKLPWNNHRLIWSYSEAWEIIRGGENICLFSLSPYPYILVRGVCAWGSLTHIFWVRSVCGAAPTSAVYPCLKLLSNKIVSDETKRSMHVYTVFILQKCSRVHSATPLKVSFDS